MSRSAMAFVWPFARSAAVQPDAERMRDFIDALDEPALLLSASMVALANRAAKALLGSGIEGRDVRLAIRHPQALERILERRTGEVDVSGIVELGRSWRLSVHALAGDMTLVRMIDRTEAVSAEKMRVDFVANASHELRTPLSTIIGYAETLAEDAELPPDLRLNFGRTIRDEARRMLRIIEDLMSLSRIEADRFVAPADEVELRDVIEAAVANCAQLLEIGRCEISVDVPADVPPVRGDRAQLVQVLDNLLGNALRYGCDAPGSKVELAVATNGPRVTLTVTDHGPGIAREHLPRLTQRFYRVDPGRSRDSGGTGLGLAIVKHIVERHRGSLDIQSTLGLGTTVSVSLPAAR